MRTLEAVYDGRAFVPVAPVHLEKNQRVVLSFFRNVPPGKSEPALYELLQNSPFRDAELDLERDKTPMRLRDITL